MDQAPDTFRHIVEANADALWLVDPSGRTSYANRTFAAMIDLDAAHPERLIGRRPEELLSDPATQPFLAQLGALDAAQEELENLETTVRLADGRTVRVLASRTAVRDDEGLLLGWLHRIVRLDRVRLWERLEAREAQLADARKLARLGSWEMDLRTGGVAWSEQMWQMTGTSPDTFTPSLESFVELVHPDDREMVRTSVDAVLGGADELSWVARLVRPTGEQRWIRCVGVVEPGADGARARLTGTAQDVTEVALADEQAAVATRRLRLLQQMAAIANRASSVADAMRSAAQGLPHFARGWAAVCLYCVEDGELVLHEEYGAGARPELALAAQARHTRDLVVGSPATSPGSHSLVAVPVSAGEEVVAVVELLANEAPPDDASYELMGQFQSQMGLVAARERAARDLASARDQAMEASRLKSEFLATMSHEIRTPMNGVIGLNELLLRTDLDPRQRRLGEALQGAGRSLMAIINDILDLSKIESGKLELEEADFDVRAVFEQTADLLGGPAREKGLELVVACQPDVPAVLRGDATRLGQVLTNLGSNAIKFTERGEVVVRATLAECDRQHATLRVEVSDTGVGIPVESQRDVFHAFTQADRSTTRQHGGTGLGLAISRQLVEALGGTIDVESEPGRGSTFVFTARFSTPAALSLPRRRASEALVGRRVLVVDDNATSRLVLAEQLAAWQLRPVAACSARDALETLRDAVRAGDPFELALLDEEMPDTGGARLAEAIHADAALTGLTLLLMSADPTTVARPAGGSGVGLGSHHAISTTLGKPVRHSELYDALLGALATGPVESSPAPPTERDDTRPLAGLRILVVEDNAVNQLVATGTLESLGARVDVAGDGAEAVPMLAGAHPYAAVLMDCRMPQLDGFDATRAIRRDESMMRRVPIIAMTASALEGERERCLAAGMDDFLAKPVVRADLARVLRRWTGPHAALTEPVPPTDDGRPAASADTGGASPVPAPPPAQVLDPARVRMLDELTKDGVSFFDRTAASFMSRIDDQVAAIQEAVDAGDPVRIFTSSHLVKGSALNLGVNLVAAAAERIETRAGTSATDGYAALMTALRHEIHRAAAALQAVTS